MGIKNDKMTQGSVETAELMVEKLAPLGNVTSKKMFGGHGIFLDGKMFGIIDSKGQPFLKADDSNMDQFKSAGAEQHSRMPYYAIPMSVLSDFDVLLEWAKRSAAIAK